MVLDATVLIAHLDGGDGHHDRATALLEASGVDSFGASTITLAETLVAPARAGRLADAERALRHLGVDELSLGQDAASRLAETRARAGLKMPDCCVLLAAQEHEATVVSFDEDLLSAARKLGLDTLS